MATAYDIADRLIEHGDEVPDKESFVKKMSDPKFSEAVRTQLKAYGDEVPDSATFHGRYGASVPSNGYGYAKPEDYELLKRNVSQVGYSGLDENQKKLFQSQFPSSKYAKAGGSFEDAIKYVDSQSEKGLHPDQYISREEADARNANAGDAYTLARDVLITGLSPYTAGLEYIKDRAFNEGSWATGDGDSYAKYIQNHMEAGNKGEGVVGFIGNPTNVIAAKLPLNMVGVAGMGVLAGGESAYNDIRNAEVTGSPVDVTETGKNALLAGGLAAGLHGGFSGASWLGQKGGQSFAKPYIDVQAEAERQIAENASKAERLAKIKENAPAMSEWNAFEEADIHHDKFGNPSPEWEAKMDKLERTFEGAKASERRQIERTSSPDEERLRRDRPELFYGERTDAPYDPQVEYNKQLEAREILDQVKIMMMTDHKRFPEYDVGRVDLRGPASRMVRVSDEAAAKYLRELENQTHPNISSKGYEALKGFPLVQRALGWYPKFMPGSELAAGLADKAFVLPNLMNKPGIYQAPVHAVAPLVLRGSVAGADQIDSAVARQTKKGKDKLHEGGRALIQGIR